MQVIQYASLTYSTLRGWRIRRLYLPRKYSWLYDNYKDGYEFVQMDVDVDAAPVYFVYFYTPYETGYLMHTVALFYLRSLFLLQ